MLGRLRRGVPHAGRRLRERGAGLAEPTGQRKLRETKGQPLWRLAVITSTIAVSGLAAEERVTLRVFDLSGALVASLFEGESPEHGELRIAWDTGSNAAGMYFFEAINGERSVRGKLILE